MSTAAIQALKERRATSKAGLDSIVAACELARRDLTAGESTQFDVLVADVRTIDTRIDELERNLARENLAARARAEMGAVGPQSSSGWSVGTEASTYHRGADSPSYFRDMIHAGRGDANAQDRLRRNNTEVALESRALSTTAGAGGEFAPPLWLVDQFVKLARPGRVTADLFRHETLPPGVSSVNLPRVATGTTTAVQTTQNSAVSQTDATSASLTSGISTIAGKQVISQQLIDQSGIPFDEIILQDLTADYAKQLGTQALTGTGASGQLRGYLTPASTNILTWTQATPTAGGFYSQLAKLQGQINVSRFTSPDTVVMNPRRWAWLASYVDSTGRPLVVPSAGGFNSMAQPGDALAAGHVGSILGMDVYTDPNIPINLGAGTNQDVVLMFPRSDVWLWESNLRAEALTQPYGDSLGVLLRVYNYAALIPDRYLASLGQLSGTGLVTPVFVS